MRLFRNLELFEKVLLGFGTMLAVFAGVMLPSLSLFMGNIAVAFSEDQAEVSNLQGTLGEISITVGLVAVGLAVCSYGQYAFW